MDPKLLLVKSITLLFKESLMPNASSNSAELIRQVTASLKFPETGMDHDRSREIMHALRATALWMCDNPPEYHYDRVGLVQRIRVNAGEDESLFYALEQGILEQVTTEELTYQCKEARHEILSALNKAKVQEICKHAYHKLAFGSDGLDMKEFTQDLAVQLEPYVIGGINKIDGQVDGIDLANLDEVASIMVRAQTEASPEGVLRFGWQGLNRVTGEHGGAVRGDSWVVGALQHNFKTGFTLSMFKHMALYNKPWMINPEKKPLLVHISTENSLSSNVMWLYANLKENETGVECDLANVNIEEATRYVNQRMSAMGYHIKMYRWNPSEVTYHSIYELVQQLEAQGYEIHAMVFDYLNMISKKGCMSGPAGFEVRDLYRRVRNFMAPRRIFFLTPHQLSTEAKQLIRSNVEMFVQEIANKGYYDSCKTVDQEVDLELYIHIVKVNGVSYLTCQRGKHRKLRPTPEKDLYFVLPFSPVGAILDDINGKDSTRRHAGGGTVGGGDEVPWWQQAA